MSVTITFEKKHFLMAGLIIALPFMILAISNIFAATTMPLVGHSISELFVDGNLDMNGFNLTNTETITLTSLCFDGVCKSSWSELAETILWGNNNLETNEGAYCESQYGTAPVGGWYYYDRNAIDGACIIVYNGWVGTTCPSGYQDLKTITEQTTGCCRFFDDGRTCFSSCTTGFHPTWGNDPFRETVSYTTYCGACITRTVTANVLYTKCVHS
ncbi:MAG: hypothetical protein KAI18_00170 [Candidatus Aenigmarchaeota archaeon]|nr:hypothetical protein [Candidatus Aenigmarchaeota archaeon]